MPVRLYMGVFAYQFSDVPNCYSKCFLYTNEAIYFPELAISNMKQISMACAVDFVGTNLGASLLVTEIIGGYRLQAVNAIEVDGHYPSFLRHS